MPNATGGAVGCFESPDAFEPTASAWCQSQHAWVVFPGHWKTSDTQAFGHG